MYAWRSQGSYQCANQHQAVAVKIQPFPTILQSLKFDDFQQTPSSRISEFLGEAPQRLDKLFFFPPPPAFPVPPTLSEEQEVSETRGGGTHLSLRVLGNIFNNSLDISI